MIICYLRSSSYTTWDLCPLKYFINYTLNIKEGINKAANLGSICHKVWEIIALEKLARQNDETTITDEEVFGTIPVGIYSVDELYDIAFDYYHDLDTEREYTKKDKKDYREQVHKVLNSMYNPANLNIIAAEPKFDIPLNFEWAKYEFILPNGEELKGQFSIKGSIDLVTELKSNPKVYEICDWKSGRRWS